MSSFKAENVWFSVCANWANCGCSQLISIFVGRFAPNSSVKIWWKPKVRPKSLKVASKDLILQKWAHCEMSSWEKYTENTDYTEKQLSPNRMHLSVTPVFIPVKRSFMAALRRLNSWTNEVFSLTFWQRVQGTHLHLTLAFFTHNMLSEASDQNGYVL